MGSRVWGKAFHLGRELGLSEGIALGRAQMKQQMVSAAGTVLRYTLISAGALAPQVRRQLDRRAAAKAPSSTLPAAE